MGRHAAWIQRCSSYTGSSNSTVVKRWSCWSGSSTFRSIFSATSRTPQCTPLITWVGYQHSKELHTTFMTHCT